MSVREVRLAKIERGKGMPTRNPKESRVRSPKRWRVTRENDIDWLVDSVSQERARMLRSCEMLTETGLLVCGSLNSARSLLEPYMAVLAVAHATGSTFEVRFSVACQGCNGRTTWSIPLGSLRAGLLLLRNLERGMDALTSITWQITLRPKGRKTDIAYGAWQLAATPAATQVIPESGSGVRKLER